MKRSESAKLDAASLLLYHERRSAVRHRISFPVPCWLADGGPVLKAHIRDMSTLGVALSVPQKLQLGVLLEIELQSVAVGPLRRVMARLVHIEQEERGWWVASCAFVTELSAAELKLVRADAIRTKTADQRRWVRFPCQVETACYPSQTPELRQPARIVNISAGGVGLLLPSRFEQGALLHFEIPADAQPGPRMGLVRVVHTMEHSAGTWYHGCEFAQQLSAEDLAAFS